MTPMLDFVSESVLSEQPAALVARPFHRCQQLHTTTPGLSSSGEAVPRAHGAACTPPRPSKQHLQLKKYVLAYLKSRQLATFTPTVKLFWVT